MIRLDGLEPENPLAFLALLGLLRALEAGAGADAALPRVVWDVARPPLRPAVLLGRAATAPEVAERAAAGLAALAPAYAFDGRPKLDYPRPEARGLLENAALASGPRERGRADLLAALMSDAVGEEDGGAGPGAVGPSPLCLLKGQGHQCFLETLAAVATRAAPATGGRRAARAAPSATACLDAALFRPWRRQDPARQATFRWDPADAARQAYLAGDPTDPKYQQGTEFGANRLAAAGLATLTVVPQRHRDRLVPCIPGGAWEDGFSFAWPIWTEPATLPAILALLNHPQLRVPGALAHLGVAHVFCAKRISVLRFLNLTPGRVLTGQGSAAPGA